MVYKPAPMCYAAAYFLLRHMAACRQLPAAGRPMGPPLTAPAHPSSRHMPRKSFSARWQVRLLSAPCKADRLAVNIQASDVSGWWQLVVWRSPQSSMPSFS